MSNALVGHTGFVGGNLLLQEKFDDLYNSSNIESIEGKAYDLLVCAGAPAIKWKANQEPEKDLANLERLMSSLDKVTARHAILISTVDVYPSLIAVDEDTSIDEDSGSHYGKHRLMLERFIQSRFDSTTIRLPGLFGPGLKKNIIYDFLNDYRLEMIYHDSIFQFYNIKNLWWDIKNTRQNDIELINFATEGTSVREVAQEGFGFEFTNPSPTNPVRYDFRTKYDYVFGATQGYIYNKEQVLSELKEFISSSGYAQR